jgi:hypothetical protein
LLLFFSFENAVEVKVIVVIVGDQQQIEFGKFVDEVFEKIV